MSNGRQRRLTTGELSRAPASWNIPGAEIITDNCGNYCAYNKTGHLYYIQAKTGEVMSFRLMQEEKVQLIDKERYHVVRDSRGILWISTYGNGFYTYDLHTGHLSHFKAMTHVLLFCFQMSCYI